MTTILALLAIVALQLAVLWYRKPSWVEERQWLEWHTNRDMAKATLKLRRHVERSVAEFNRIYLILEPLFFGEGSPE